MSGMVDGYAKIVARAVADNAKLSAGNRCMFTLSSMGKVLTDVMRARCAGDDAIVEGAARRIRRELFGDTPPKPSYDMKDLAWAFENLDFQTLPLSTWASIETDVVRQLPRPRLERPRRREPRAVAVPGPPVPPVVAGPGGANTDNNKN